MNISQIIHSKPGVSSLKNRDTMESEPGTKFFLKKVGIGFESYVRLNTGGTVKNAV